MKLFSLTQSPNHDRLISFFCLFVSLSLSIFVNLLEGTNNVALTILTILSYLKKIFHSNIKSNFCHFSEIISSSSDLTFLYNMLTVVTIIFGYLFLHAVYPPALL